MARTTVECKKKITLELNEQEAQYLKGLLQNPYMYVATEDEDSPEPIHEASMREELFEALEEALS